MAKTDRVRDALADVAAAHHETAPDVPTGSLIQVMFRMREDDRDELRDILERTTTGHDPEARAIVGGEQILAAQKLVCGVAIAPHVQDYAIRLVLATHPEGEFAVDMVNRFVRFGASPRGAQALVLSAKVRAMLDERYHVNFADVAAGVLPTLRHRTILNFEGQAEGVSNDDVLDNILQETPRSADQAISMP